MNKKKPSKKNNKQLLFLETFNKSMTVDEIYLKLLKVFKQKDIKIYPDKK